MENWNEYIHKHNLNAGHEINLGLNRIETLIRITSERKGKVWILGNGGSATTADHFAADLSLTKTRGGISIAAFSLVSGIGWLTALSNDYSYEDVFKMQLQNILEGNDLVIGLSASGNSQNLINGLLYAQKCSVKTFSFLGFDGGRILKEKIGESLLFETQTGEYGIVENLHLMAVHYLAEKFRK